MPNQPMTMLVHEDEPFASTGNSTMEVVSKGIDAKLGQRRLKL
ncbi:MAG: hypothetical protein ABI895_09675 [Deltaproteobacteria bacterium]